MNEPSYVVCVSVCVCAGMNDEGVKVSVDVYMHEVMFDCG